MLLFLSPVFPMRVHFIESNLIQTLFIVLILQLQHICVTPAQHCCDLTNVTQQLSSSLKEDRIIKKAHQIRDEPCWKHPSLPIRWWVTSESAYSSMKPSRFILEALQPNMQQQHHAAVVWRNGVHPCVPNTANRWYVFTTDVTFLLQWEAFVKHPLNCTTVHNYR